MYPTTTECSRGTHFCAEHFRAPESTMPVRQIKEERYTHWTQRLLINSITESVSPGKRHWFFFPHKLIEGIGCIIPTAMVEIARKIGGEDGAEACGKVIDNCGIIALPVKIFLFIVALLTSILLFPLTAPAEAIGRALNAHDEKTEGLKKQYLDALIQLTLVSKDIPIEPCFNKEDQTQAINYLCSILPGVIRDESHPPHRLS